MDVSFFLSDQSPKKPCPLQFSLVLLDFYPFNDSFVVFTCEKEPSFWYWEKSDSKDIILNESGKFYFQYRGWEDGIYWSFNPFTYFVVKSRQLIVTSWLSTRNLGGEDVGRVECQTSRKSYTTSFFIVFVGPSDLLNSSV